LPQAEFYDQVSSLSFGAKREREVGLGFLPRVRPQGEASVVQRVVNTPDGVISDVLKGLQIRKKSEQNKFRKGNSFYTVLLDLVVRMPDPVRTFLEYARFGIRVGVTADILKFAPEKDGVKAVLKKSGVRGFTISPNLEIGTSLPGVKAKVGANIDYTNSRGWAVEVPINIDDVIGARVKSNEVAWHVRGNRDIEVPGQLVSLTSVLKASFIVKVPRDLGVDANITADGRIVKDTAFIAIGVHGRINLITPDKLRIPGEGAP